MQYFHIYKIYLFVIKLGIRHIYLCSIFSVPAQIIDELSSDDVTVQEGDTVILVCNVTGVPKPEVTWYRRPANSKITERQSKMCKPRSHGPGKIPSFATPEQQLQHEKGTAL